MNIIKYITLCVIGNFFTLKGYGDTGPVIPGDLTPYYSIIKIGKLYELTIPVKLSMGVEAYPDQVIYTNGGRIVIEGRGLQSFERIMLLEAGGRSLTPEELTNLVLPFFHYYTEDFCGVIIDNDYLRSWTKASDKIKVAINRLKSIVSTPKATCSHAEWVLDYYVIRFSNGNSVVHYIVLGEQKTFHIKEIRCIYLKDKFDDIPPLDK
jgi:hypothetical protein